MLKAWHLTEIKPTHNGIGLRWEREAPEPPTPTDENDLDLSEIIGIRPVAGKGSRQDGAPLAGKWLK